MPFSCIIVYCQKHYTGGMYRTMSADIEILQGYIDATRDAGTGYEGSASTAQREYLARLASQSTVRRIAEIGFNGGISAANFLLANPDATVRSFDLNRYDYTDLGKAHIDKRFPGRHQLIIGDSAKTVPIFADENPETKFDLIFIDGGHEFEAAKADIRNMRELAHAATVLVVDDLSPWTVWGIGPVKAWNEALQADEVYQNELLQNGLLVGVPLESEGEKVWVTGGYRFEN